MITRPQLRVVLMLVIWGVTWNFAWNWLTRPRPVTRIELPSVAGLLSVSDTGLASVKMDITSPHVEQDEMAYVWDMKTGLECPLPFRPDDVFLNHGLDYQEPCFVLREGCVHQIDAITGETIQRYEELPSASHVQASPDRLRLLVQSSPMSYDLFDVTKRKVLWSYSPPIPNEEKSGGDDYVSADSNEVQWRCNDLVFAENFSADRAVLIDASTGVQTPCSPLSKPYLTAKINGQFIAVDRFGSVGLRIKNYVTNQVLATLTYHDQWIDSLNTEQLRLSNDGLYVLIDYLALSGKTATVQWDMTDQKLNNEVTILPIMVAPNGSVLERRTELASRWELILGRKVRSILRLYSKWTRSSSVYDSSGERLLQLSQTSDNSIFYHGLTEAFTDGGRGLVVYNNSGLEYYLVPPHGQNTIAYWLGLLAPPLAWWGIGRFRKRNSPPVTMTV